MNRVILTYVRFANTLHVLGCRADRVRDLRPVGCFEPDWASIALAHERIRAQMNHAADSGEVSGAVLEDVRSLCGFLFDELVPLEAKRWLRDEAGTLTISLPPELLDLPWELLHTGTDFLGLTWAMGRVVQLDRDAEPHRPRPSRTPRVLVVADPNGELHESYDEGLTLRAQLRSSERARVSFRGGDVDAALLRRQARAHDLIHYAGHIDADGWRMADSRFDRAAVERLSGGAPLPAVIFANGCGGASATNYEHSMLDAWLTGGVRHVIGPLFDLPDRLGRLFCERFYQALLDGAAIGAAARSARLALAAAVGEGTTPWGAYVLYGNPDITYFDVSSTASIPAQATERTGPTRLRPQPTVEAVRREAVATRRDDAIGRSNIDMLFLLVLALMLLSTLAALSISGGPGFGDWGETTESTAFD